MRKTKAGVAPRIQSQRQIPHVFPDHHVDDRQSAIVNLIRLFSILFYFIYIDLDLRMSSIMNIPVLIDC